MQHNSMMMNQGGGLDPEYATINTTTTTTTTITNTTTSFTTSFLSTSAYFAPSQAQQQQQQQQQQLAHVRNDENSFVDDIFPFEDNALRIHHIYGGYDDYQNGDIEWKFNAVVEDPRLRESHHAFENQNNNIISILNDACFGSELLNSLEDPTMVPLTPTQISPMSEDISGFVAVPPPPLPMDDVTTIVPRAPGDSKKGKRKSPSTPSGTGAAKRKVTTTTTTTAIKTRCGDNHSGVSRNDVAEGVVPFIHVLTQLWHDPMHRTEMCTIPVKSYRVEHRVLFRGLLKQALRESIENCLGAVTKDIDHSRAFQALAALVLHVQRGCTDVNLMTVIINGKACVKIVGKRPCGCCPVSNNLQVPSDRWDKLSCSKTTKTVLKQRK